MCPFLTVQWCLRSADVPLVRTLRWLIKSSVCTCTLVALNFWQMGQRLMSRLGVHAYAAQVLLAVCLFWGLFRLFSTRFYPRRNDLATVLLWLSLAWGCMSRVELIQKAKFFPPPTKKGTSRERRRPRSFRALGCTVLLYLYRYRVLEVCQSRTPGKVCSDTHTVV